MYYKTVLERNGKIRLPKDVIEKLQLKEGDDVVIRVSYLPQKKGYYAYLSSREIEVIDALDS